MDTMDEVLQMSRLTKLDVKWSSELQGNEHIAEPKANPNFELLMVTEGPVYLQAGGRRMELQSGECYLLMPWEQHSGYRPISASAGFYWVQFSADPPLRLPGGTPDEAAAAMPNRPRLAAQDLRTAKDDGCAADALLLPRRFKPRNRYELLRLFELMGAQLAEPRGYYRYRCSLLLAQMLELLAHGLLEREQLQHDMPSTFLLYRRIVNKLDEDYMKNPSSEALEQSLHHNYEYLCQIFKKYSGTTIVSYIHQLQIQRAKHLLAATGAMIKEVAEQVGYQDPYYFSRIFKKLEAISPQQFRNLAMRSGAPRD
ncbi:AraC family transcriptional regulator [Paenibacillus rhizovicinus]|uniref:AraC family transcriptional regulator n=1 Tax=Paenibacillus rhizovicinus TaxID=2704463 RepID=A0A6C0P0L3_9BACL|nr:AraC family transcriptional regulator [Paenibacillus rhizovicinus]QHW31999.1 AraC family transcriptional regulator [Paenibacillus rhizovicinus]